MLPYKHVFLQLIQSEKVEALKSNEGILQLILSHEDVSEVSKVRTIDYQVVVKACVRASAIHGAPFAIYHIESTLGNGNSDGYTMGILLLHCFI